MIVRFALLGLPALLPASVHAAQPSESGLALRYDLTGFVVEPAASDAPARQAGPEPAFEPAPPRASTRAGRDDRNVSTLPNRASDRTMLAYDLTGFLGLVGSEQSYDRLEYELGGLLF